MLWIRKFTLLCNKINWRMNSRQEQISLFCRRGWDKSNAQMRTAHMVLILSDWRRILSWKAAEACLEGGRTAAAGVSDALPTFSCDVKCQTPFKFYFQPLQGARQFFLTSVLTCVSFSPSRWFRSPCLVISEESALAGTPTPWRTERASTCTRSVKSLGLGQDEIFFPEMLLLHSCTSPLRAVHPFQVYLLSLTIRLEKDPNAMTPKKDQSWFV